MRLSELIALCDAPCGLDGVVPDHIYLTVQRPRLPRGETIRLCGRIGPRGRLCTVKEAPAGGYACVAVFKRAEVKVFAQAQEGRC